MSKVLFICKLNENNPCTGYYGDFRKFSGLFNSAKFVVAALNQIGHIASIENAVDNNDIDRLVSKHKPDFVVIEALWVVPEKFNILEKLHPKVTWIVRLHSKIPFLSNEGIAMGWIMQYLNNTNVIIAPNSTETTNDLLRIAGKKHKKRIVYLPNYYDPGKSEKRVVHSNSEVHIGCFGAIRPFKNQLSQAMAAIEFANSNNKELYFHINSTRIEGRGESVLKNIRQLFEFSHKHNLIEHDWVEHEKFRLLCSKMDFGIQCSFTETFNIVTADFVSENVPVVVSPEIAWMPFWTFASPNSISSMVNTLNRVACLDRFGVTTTNRLYLSLFSERSINIWDTFLKN